MRAEAGMRETTGEWEFQYIIVDVQGAHATRIQVVSPQAAPRDSSLCTTQNYNDYNNVRAFLSRDRDYGATNLSYYELRTQSRNRRSARSAASRRLSHARTGA